ncbi:MAG: DUF6675 family protein [Rectinemataceae bacterium]
MKRLLFVAICALAGVAAFAQVTSSEYLSFLSDAERKSLVATGEVNGFGSKLEDLALWRKAPFAAAVRTAFPDRPSTIAAEGLFILDLPPAGASQPVGASQPAAASQDLDLRILKAFTAFSAMKGLQVYSASLKRMETFIYDSWQIDSLESKKKLPDPVFESAPDHAQFLLYQKEEQTGDVYSSMSFDARDGLYEVQLTNETALHYLIFTLVAPRRLSTLFIVVPTTDKLILYGVTVADTPRFLGLERSKSSSFFYRMKALTTWFSANLARQ